MKKLLKLLQIPEVTVSVRDESDQNKLGHLSRVSGTHRFRTGDRLVVQETFCRDNKLLLGATVNGRHGYATFVVTNGNFSQGQRLLVTHV